ncbi:MAG TPA: aldehyde dehydrogenase family protein [Candidatus Udaeobacter sp.]|nr:aldehyde dehydrogenase family protein [Candidatus Udaeobacter sp.]
MSHEMQFYIDGQWVDPIVPASLDVIDPSTEEPFATISIGSAKDVDRAVAAAKAAFPAFSRSDRRERLELLQRILEGYKARRGDIARAISREVGAPAKFAMESQSATGIAHLERMIQVLRDFEFERQMGTSRVVREPIGVCGLITPWNWPVNQITCKVAPALAAGCTMVLKPSELAPLNGIIFAEILHDAGVPEGVFNLVNGDGATVGQAIASHPDIDMVSFTGSTRAGVLVAKAAADTVKRVHQELGGKSANIILADADLARAVQLGVSSCFRNSGQSCNAPTRMLVPANRQAEAVAIAKAAAETIKVGAPSAETTVLGPVISQLQFDKVQGLIESGIAEGARLVTGGLGRPEGLNRGYYVRPTVFADVRRDMRVSREEIFGPVLSIMTYETEAEAVEIANDTPYGLAAYVQSGDLGHAREIASQLRSGNVHLNYPAWDTAVPFGGYRQSGNGREYGEFGLDAFLETKAVIGYGAPRPSAS